ncbi:Uncharacterized protein dnm_002920 [Desulfonema magnum]|uniref:Uncharacterized protein n=1 Tax=Desulfonema magnum TaxID=45655 RepID=A0A975GL06_9BACT|nr:Uncharacterized protein dnm_002920 [Desulfonema magnum]
MLYGHPKTENRSSDFFAGRGCKPCPAKKFCPAKHPVRQGLDIIS